MKMILPELRKSAIVGYEFVEIQKRAAKLPDDFFSRLTSLLPMQFINYLLEMRTMLILHTADGGEREWIALDAGLVTPDGHLYKTDDAHRRRFADVLTKNSTLKSYEEAAAYWATKPAPRPCRFYQRGTCQGTS